MKLLLAYYGDPILRKKTLPVQEINEEIHQLIRDMEETMFAHDGIGLAAPQIHKSLAIFIVNVPVQTGPETWENGTTKVFINPKILEYSQETWDRGEGCLSIPNLYGVVRRPLRIKVEALNEKGELFTEEFSGLEARAILHENDHINGVLFIDRIHGKEREQLEPYLKTIKKKYSKP